MSHARSRRFCVQRSTSRFLTIRPLAASEPDELIVVENWFEELRAKSRK